jgi:hypothetical protein
MLTTPRIRMSKLGRTCRIAIRGEPSRLCAKGLAARKSIRGGTRMYVASAWRYASAAGLPALAALLIIR